MKNPNDSQSGNGNHEGAGLFCWICLSLFLAILIAAKIIVEFVRH